MRNSRPDPGQAVLHAGYGIDEGHSALHLAQAPSKAVSPLLAARAVVAPSRNSKGGQGSFCAGTSCPARVLVVATQGVFKGIPAGGDAGRRVGKCWRYS